MQIETIVTTIFIGVLFSCCLIAFRFLIHKLIQGATEKIWFASGILLFLSLLVIFSEDIDSYFKQVSSFSYLPTLFKVFWWLSLNYLLNQLIEFWNWNRVFVKKGITISRIVRNLISIVFMILTIASIIYFVFDTSVLGLFTASGVMAIILGYSAQATLSDIFAGLGLNASKEFVEGDWIKVNDQTGKVVEISWRYVKLLTKDSNNLTYANSIISKLPITNLSSPSSTRAITLVFPIKGAISPATFKNLLVSAALQCHRVSRLPKPKATLVVIGDLNYQYKLTYYTNDIDESSANDDILSIVWYMCRREHISTTSTVLSLPENPAINDVKKFIKRNPLFKALNNDELKQLCAKLVYHHFGPPERVLEQGQSNSSLYLIYSGSVEVFLATEANRPVQVAILNADQYFGEMSLLTGEACTASIFVKEESLIIEITHDNMADIFAKRPVLIEKISEVVVLRRQENENVKASQVKPKKEESITLISRMVRSVQLFFK